MSVGITKALQDLLADSGADPQLFVQTFQHWKANWPENEYSNYFFGKDGAYAVPKVGGDKNKLRHVHLVPLCDQEALTLWERAFRRLSRKTSDRALVYVDDGRGNYLLIFILDEPDAHSICRMENERDKSVMESFAIIAEDFLFDGRISG